MPRTATASKSTTAKPARKTRSRKATPARTVTSPAVTKEKIEECLNAPTRSLHKVTTTTFVGGKVKSKKSEFPRPSTARLITWERYQKDILTRWQIHQYEVQELIKDFQKGLDFVTPYHTELVKRVKAVNL